MLIMIMITIDHDHDYDEEDNDDASTQCRVRQPLLDRFLMIYHFFVVAIF